MPDSDARSAGTLISDFIFTCFVIIGVVFFISSFIVIVKRAPKTERKDDKQKKKNQWKKE